MRKKQTEENKLTAEEYRLRAKMNMLACKNEMKIFLFTGLVLVTALTIITVIAVAWFASNREVQGRNMMVTIAGSSYELAVMGEKGEWDTDESVSTGEEQEIDGNNYWTTGKDSAILWALNDNSNLENQKGEGRGIEPGSRGSMTFYILAKTNDNLTVNFSLQMIGQLEDGGKIPEDAAELMLGHILLFAGYDTDNSSYCGWISEDAETWTMNLDSNATLKREEDGTLTWTGNVENGKVYPVTIYWIWPDTFGQYLFKNQVRIGKNPVLFPDDKGEGIDSISALPEGLFEKMCQTPEGAVSNRYLKWSRESDLEQEKQLSKEEFKELVTVEGLLNIRNEKEYNIAFYGKLCNYYNKADQYIGENIAYVKLKLETK